MQINLKRQHGIWCKCFNTELVFWKHQVDGYTYWEINPAILISASLTNGVSFQMKEFASLQLKECASFRAKIFRINKYTFEDFAIQGSEQEVINSSPFINSSKTQRCTATVPSLYKVSFNIESNSTWKEVAPLVHIRTKTWKHIIREKNGKLLSQLQYLD